MAKKVPQSDLLTSALLVFAIAGLAVSSVAASAGVAKLAYDFQMNLGPVALSAAVANATDDTPVSPTPIPTYPAYCPQLSQTAQRGDRDATTTPAGQVTELQKFLSGYYSLDPQEIVTGAFGSVTQNFVIRFQTEKGVPAYGVVGTLTRDAIRAAAPCVTGYSDTQRKADLQTLATALNLYYQKHGTYTVSGSGAGGTGGGVISGQNLDGPPTYKSIMQGLIDDGDLASALSSAGGTYLLYICDAGQTYALSAKLDNPSAADIAYIQTTCNSVGSNGTYTLYGRNYAVQGTTPNLQQFGYYTSDDSANGNFTAAVASSSNMVWVQPNGWTNTTIVDHIRIAKDAGKGVVLQVENILFTEPGNGTTFQLNPFSTFDAMWTQVQAAGLTSTVKGFYLFDEPFDRFTSTTTSCASNTPCTSATTLFWDLTAAGNYLHRVAPGVATMMLGNAPRPSRPNGVVQLNNIGLWIPSSLDYLGFNCYYASGGGASCPTYLSQAYQAVATARPSLKMFVMPDAWWCTSGCGTLNDDALATQLKSLISLTRSSNNITGSYAFIYQTVLGAGVKGLQSGEFPKTYQALQNWYKEIRQAGGAPDPAGITITTPAVATTLDAQRKQELLTLANALNKYYQKHGTYVMSGSGASGVGVGVVANDGAPTYKTIIQGLYADGDLATPANLPGNPREYYLLYTCGPTKFALSAKLDSPTTANINYIQTTCNGTGGNGTYTLYKRNYAITGDSGTITVSP